MKETSTQRPSGIRTTRVMRAVGHGHERERLAARHLPAELRDHRAVRVDDREGVRARRRRGLQHAAPHALGEHRCSLGVRDQLPALLAHDLLEQRVADHRPARELAVLPVAQLDLPQVHQQLRLEALHLQERRGGLPRPLQRRDEDGADRLLLEPHRHGRRLVAPVLVERRVVLRSGGRVVGIHRWLRTRSVAHEDHLLRSLWRGEGTLEVHSHIGIITNAHPTD